MPDTPVRKPINLALQGGGAHGAFSWGVIDALLEDGRLVIEGISGTSAGAMNAVVLADGLAEGGPATARRKLTEFWHAIADRGRFSPLQRTALERLLGGWNLDGSPMFAWLDMMSHFLSPYDTNPLNINPLEDLVEQFVNFRRLRACTSLELFVSATNVRTGRPHIFERKQINARAVMASACLPLLFQAVEIGGEAYWDGGYVGNPALFPFFHATKTEDVLLVQINPVKRAEVPTSAREIIDRVNEITFNASLHAELRAIEFVQRLIAQGRLPHGDGPGKYRAIKLHRIDAHAALTDLNASSKMNTEREFLDHLHDAGRKAAHGFLARHFNDIGVRGTLDIAAELKADGAAQ